VRVISRAALVAFWESRKTQDERQRAKQDLSAWYKIADDAQWPNFGAPRQAFGSADKVGDCVVFDVGNNRYRLIGRIRFKTGKLYVLAVMDHEEYDKRPWAQECGCHEPPPPPPPKKKSAVKRATQVKRRR